MLQNTEDFPWSYWSHGRPFFQETRNDWLLDCFSDFTCCSFLDLRLSFEEAPHLSNKPALQAGQKTHYKCEVSSLFPMRQSTQTEPTIMFQQEIVHNPTWVPVATKTSYTSVFGLTKLELYFIFGYKASVTRICLLKLWSNIIANIILVKTDEQSTSVNRPHEVLVISDDRTIANMGPYIQLCIYTYYVQLHVHM